MHASADGNPDHDLITEYTHDPAGNVLSETTRNGANTISLATTHEYDTTGRRIETIDALSQTTHTAYDIQGRVVATWGATYPVAYEYDAHGRMVAMATTRDSVHESVNLLALLPEGVALSDTSHPPYAVTYAYDDLGRFMAVSSSVQPVPFVANYSYLPGTDLLTGWTNAAGFAFTRSYEAHRDLVTQVENKHTGVLIHRFEYENDALGRRTIRKDVKLSDVITNFFGYNARSELIEAAMGTNNYSYRYDPIGNRVSSSNNATGGRSYMANELNQYTNIAGGVTNTPTYVADGNMLTCKGWTFAWNGENRLILASNATTVVESTYDYMGRRVMKTVNGTNTTFLYDGWNMIRETIDHPQSTITNSYVWGLDLSGSIQGAGGIGGLLGVHEGTNIFAVAYDANGNVSEYIDATGTVVARYEYDAFGNTIAQSGAKADEFSFRFSTKYFDAETGLYYYGYRFYSPGMGRWINRDPIEERGGLNVYGFIGNRSVNSFDILGLRCSLISGPEAAGSEWALERVNIRSEGASFMALVEGVDVTWKLEGSVECCCRFLLLFSRQVTKTVYNTVTKPAAIPSSSFPILAYAPGSAPISIPTPTTLPALIGELLGEIASGIVSSVLIIERDDAVTIATGVVNSRPVSINDGAWPEDPCNQ